MVVTPNYCTNNDQFEYQKVHLRGEKPRMMPGMHSGEGRRSSFLTLDAYSCKWLLDLRDAHLLLYLVLRSSGCRNECPF